MMSDLIGTFRSKQWGTVSVRREAYSFDDTLAVTLWTEGEPLATLSVHLDESDELPPNHFYAKTWSENTDLAIEAMASGLFEPTGYPPAESGFVQAPVWRIKA